MSGYTIFAQCPLRIPDVSAVNMALKIAKGLPVRIRLLITKDTIISSYMFNDWNILNEDIIWRFELEREGGYIDASSGEKKQSLRQRWSLHREALIEQLQSYLRRRIDRQEDTVAARKLFEELIKNITSQSNQTYAMLAAAEFGFK